MRLEKSNESSNGIMLLKENKKKKYIYILSFKIYHKRQGREKCVQGEKTF